MVTIDVVFIGTGERFGAVGTLVRVCIPKAGFISAIAFRPTI
ncbi:MAG: hypothetical protein WAM14_03265 [Candidatus Nitrosopolaris sp.]